MKYKRFSVTEADVEHEPDTNIDLVAESAIARYIAQFMEMPTDSIEVHGDETFTVVIKGKWHVDGMALELVIEDNERL